MRNPTAQPLGRSRRQCTQLSPRLRPGSQQVCHVFSFSTAASPSGSRFRKAGQTLRPSRQPEKGDRPFFGLAAGGPLVSNSKSQSGESQSEILNDGLLV